MESRAKAAAAARIAGLPLGKWLDRIIVEAAHGQVSSRKEVGPTEQQLVAQTLKTMSEVLAKTNERLDAIQQDQALSFWERLLRRRGGAK